MPNACATRLALPTTLFLGLDHTKNSSRAVQPVLDVPSLHSLGKFRHGGAPREVGAYSCRTTLRRELSI
jgi:hypothetical protein